MKFVKVVRKVTFVLYVISFLILITELFLGTSTLLSNVILLVNSVIITYYIITKINFNKIFKKYKMVFDILTRAHKTRYYCYFSGTEADVAEWSKIVEESGKALLNAGTLLIRDKNASYKQCQEIQEIMNKTKVLLKNIQPPV